MAYYVELLAMLRHAFRHPVSERNYHDLVCCIDLYASQRASPEEEAAALAASGWPPSYDPCEVRENIRWGMFFVPDDDAALVNAAADFKNNLGSRL